MKTYMVIVYYHGNQHADFFDDIEDASDYMFDAVDRFQASVELYRYIYDLHLQTGCYHLIGKEAL